MKCSLEGYCLISYYCRTARPHGGVAIFIKNYDVAYFNVRPDIQTHSVKLSHYELCGIESDVYIIIIIAIEHLVEFLVVFWRCLRLF